MMKIFDLASVAARRVDRQKLPGVVSVVLSLAILSEIGISVRSAYAPAKAVIKRSASLPTQGLRRDIDIQKIVNEHLFGIADVDSESIPSAKQGSMLLEGTIVFNTRGDGLAIVASESNSALVYKIGSDLPDGLRLRQVFADHVILARGLQLESLYFSKTILVASSGRQKPESEDGHNRQPHSQDVAQQPTLQRSEMSISGAITRTLNLRPASRDGSTRGIRVYGTDAPALSALGLAAGDIIHEVNGVSMDLGHPDGDGVDLQAALESGESVTAIVERHGERLPITIDPDRAAAAARQYRISNTN